MKAIGSVYESSDYNIFTFKPGNRKIDQSNVKNLVARMQSTLLPLPIIVTKNKSKYEIDEGQHTYEARKQLGHPILFIVSNELQKDGLDLKDVQHLNNSRKSWTSEEYLNSYCNLNNHIYKRFRTFVEESNVSIENAFIILGLDNSSKALNIFRDGDLKPISEDTYNIGLERAKKIHTVHEFFNKAWNRNFVRAICDIFNVPQYKHEDLIKNLGRKHTLIEPQVSVYKYKIAITDAFNYGKHNKIWLLATCE